MKQSFWALDIVLSVCYFRWRCRRRSG